MYVVFNYRCYILCLVVAYVKDMGGFGCEIMYLKFDWLGKMLS